MALVNAEEMQATIDRLTARVRQLEDTLQHTSATVSEASGSSPALPQSAPSKEEEGFLNAFGQQVMGETPEPPNIFLGTLTLGYVGDARYFGNTARSEYLVHVNQAINCMYESTHDLPGFE